LHGFVLADDAPVENLAEAQEFLLLAFEQGRDRNAGPAGHDFGDFVGGDFFLQEARGPASGTRSFSNSRGTNPSSCCTKAGARCSTSTAWC
jgi:hypothetical protein